MKEHPDDASVLYTRRTGASKAIADKAVASLNQILAPSGCGSGDDLLAAVAGNWRFMRESGAVQGGAEAKIEDVVDAAFLPL